MRFIKQIKPNIVDVTFILLVLLFFYIYFVVYMTYSRAVWYDEMIKQIVILYHELISIGR